MDAKTTNRRGAGRRHRRDAATGPAHRQPDYRHLRHPFQPQSVFSADEVQAIHDTALRVLEELGIKILLSEARKLFSGAGARIEEDMVFIGRDIVEAAIGTAPKSFRLRSINPAREQVYENGSMLFMGAGGCPNATDFERGRRPGDLDSYIEAIKLIQSFDVLHMFGLPVEPQDVPVNLRHYSLLHTQLVYGDKPVNINSRGRAQVEQGFEMIRLAHGLSEEVFSGDVWASTVINSNSPRMLDRPMAQGLIDFARAGQLAIITPFCLAGAMAPVTVAGALALQHAEALAGISLMQLAKSGAPVSYGGFSSNVDMKSGAPAFGTPEHIKMQIGSGQLARHIGLPWRSAAGAASNTPDMQAATETNMGLWGACMANATLTVHSAGWLEGGLSFGYEKFINDIEALQIIAEMCVAPVADAAEIGFEALKDVPPGGHFFATEHTMDRYRDAFYTPLVADLQNFGAWKEAGSMTSAQRATGIWKQVLAAYSQPASGAEAAENLAPYIEQKTKEGGAPILD